MADFSAFHGASVSVDAISSEDIVPFNTEELQLIGEALTALRAQDIDESELVARRFADVENLGRAVSRFPTVLEFPHLGASHRGSSTLVDALSRLTGSSRLLHTPTRVVAGRSFLIAKIHALSMASLSLSFAPDLVFRFRTIILNVVFTLLMEDVYLACLADRGFPGERKNALMSDLIGLWDRRRDPRELSHLPALSELWAARDCQVPVFGTMEGSCELMRLSLDLRGPWLSFVADRLDDRETQSALEEFLFGLAFEEIEAVRGHLSHFGLCTADRETVNAVLRRPSIYASAVGSDPRAMYEFYVERRDVALSRRRTESSGPTRTLEELYLAYLISERE